MTSDGDRREPRDGPRRSHRGDRSPKRDWGQPPSSDQAPGEEAVQVNDAYAGGGPPPDREPFRDDEQHPTGG